MKISIDELATQICKEMDDYSSEITDKMKEAVRETAKECVAEVKSKSPNRTGKYKKGWKSKSVEDRFKASATVYNSAKPQIAHLLENGHANRSGGRTRAYPHIAPAEKEAGENLAKKVEAMLKQ